MTTPNTIDEAISNLIDQLAQALAGRLAELAGKGGKSASAAPAGKRQRNYSPEALERMSASAKKRWANYRKAQGTTKADAPAAKAKAAPGKRKRHFSAAAIERIRAGSKKRWAAYRKAQKA